MHGKKKEEKVPEAVVHIQVVCIILDDRLALVDCVLLFISVTPVILWFRDNNCV